MGAAVVYSIVGTSTSRFLECIRYIQILGVFLYDVRYIQKMEELLLLSVSNKYTFLGQAVIISGVFRGYFDDYRPGCACVHSVSI